MTRAAAAVLAVAATALGTAGPAAARLDAPPAAAAGGATCPPSATLVSWSDALDGVSLGGAALGGLSSLAWDRVGGRWASAVDRQSGQPERVWFFDDLATPAPTGPPLVLRRADGVPFTGADADDEGLTVLPDGSYVVSSETEPSVRRFDRSGRLVARLPVPARFLVQPAGQATANATLEGLTSSRDGTRIVAAMEGTLAGDSGGRYRRFLQYDVGPGGWALTRQVGYRVDTGFRVPEVASYGANGLLVLESMVDGGGRHLRLYRVSLANAVDVSREPDLAATGDVVAKVLVADLDQCPPSGAPGDGNAGNPLLANVEGMGVYGPVTNGVLDLGLVSDDDSSAAQRTRVLHLRVRVG